MLVNMDIMNITAIHNIENFRIYQTMLNHIEFHSGNYFLCNHKMNCQNLGS